MEPVLSRLQIIIRTPDCFCLDVFRLRPFFFYICVNFRNFRLNFVFLSIRATCLKKPSRSDLPKKNPVLSRNVSFPPILTSTSETLYPSIGSPGRMYKTSNLVSHRIFFLTTQSNLENPHGSAPTASPALIHRKRPRSISWVKASLKQLKVFEFQNKKCHFQTKSLGTLTYSRDNIELREIDPIFEKLVGGPLFVLYLKFQRVLYQPCRLLKTSPSRRSITSGWWGSWTSNVLRARQEAGTLECGCWALYQS